MTTNEPTYRSVPSEELARLRRIEVAARELLEQLPGRRSATPMLAALAELRAALDDRPS